jgi:hypothetical protein
VFALQASVSQTFAAPGSALAVGPTFAGFLFMCGGNEINKLRREPLAFELSSPTLCRIARAPGITLPTHRITHFHPLRVAEWLNRNVTRL